MAFYADLHVHSKFSRATSRDLDLEHLALWAQKKGIGVVATGDFTHPQWFRELEEKLVPAEPGLFRLRPDLESLVDGWLGARGGEPVRFMLEVEISTIYKKDERTRKVHHLIYAPDLDKARAITASLARIGNLASDGRPILGLDSRHLLEITLEGGDGCYLVPAHIWTPWFAVLGSKSGFDTVEHCYGDLTSEIFALETGLSADPPMIGRVSHLDRYTLVSNSDAHSPPKLGREACVFDTELDYFAMRDALKTGDGYGGTVEFFPEEGKYHLDGHRKCGVRQEPDESRRDGGVCGVCGKPLTLGVMHRVSELADRAKDETPPRDMPFRNLVPLEEILSEIQGVGPKSKAVQKRYEALLHRLGPELFILEDAPLDDIERQSSSLLAEALARLRAGEVRCDAGYDGEYGTIRLFDPSELERKSHASLLFDLIDAASPPSSAAEPAPAPVEAGTSPTAVAAETVEHRGRASARDDGAGATAVPPGSSPSRERGDGILDALDPDQLAAANAGNGPLLIVAGPGTGKTRTLTHRLAHLIANRNVAPESCLAITFTRRAAAELRERLDSLLGSAAERIIAATFHRFGLGIVEEFHAELGFDVVPRCVGADEQIELLREVFALSERDARISARELSREKRESRASGDTLAEYERSMRERDLIDFDDLIALPVRLFDARADLAETVRARHSWIAVDEYQDVDPLQYRFLRHLAPPGANICAIGDPDQSIYGFRGSDVGIFQRFTEDYPGARTVTLTRNYRSSGVIVDAAQQMVAPTTLVPGRSLSAVGERGEPVVLRECASERAEAEAIVEQIERAIGGSTFFSLDSGRVASGDAEPVADGLSFGDLAILYRTDRQADAISEALDRSGIPYQRNSHERFVERPEIQQLLTALQTSEVDARDSSVLEMLKAAARVVGESADRVLPLLTPYAERSGRDLEAFAKDVALTTDADYWDPRADRVSLLTLHAAKGLEFPFVCIAGCEDGLVPLRFGDDDAIDVSEERRLFFVGMTRARERLVLLHAKKRARHGRSRVRKRSPFVDAIEGSLVGEERARGKRRARPEFTQLTLFDGE